MSMRLINRTERLSAIERMLFRNAMGLRVVEIAKACGVDRRTIYRDLSLLDKSGVPISQHEGRFFINRDYYLASVRLNLNEAVVLFLAARMMSRYAEQPNPHIVSALTKLGLALPEPLASHVSFLAESVRSSPVDPNFVEVLETITRAWVERRRVKLWGSAARSGDVNAREFAAYFIEPTMYGELYVIGFDASEYEVRAFKLDSIKRVKLLDTTYDIPAGFDRRPYLASVWGIAGGDGETRVVLAFSPDVTPLIKERLWHTSQRIETLPDKRCTLSVQVGEWRTLLPWIRSWGAQVEVLEPPALREELAAEAARVGLMYGSVVHARQRG